MHEPMGGTTGTAVRALPLLVALAAAGLLVAGCDGQLRRKGEAPAATDRNVAEEEDWNAYGAEDAVAGYATESDRTAAMEDKAAELQQQYDDALANAGTDEERMRAYQEFEAGRQELNEMAEEGAEDEYPPPPAP